MISDLHVGENARAADMRPFWKKRSDVRARDEGYLAQFAEYTKQHALSADYLMVAGDISDQARLAEYKTAAQALEQVQRALSVPDGNVIIVPGNHDVDWYALDFHDGPPEGMPERYRNFRDPLIGLEATVGHSLCEPPYFGLLEYSDLVVLTINSAAYDSAEPDPHFGEVKEETLKSIETKLQSLAVDDERVRVLLLHHHVYPHERPKDVEVDFSQLRRAGELLDLCGAFRFDLIVHGHKHVPRFITAAFNGSPWMPILGAGSFSVLLPDAWAASVANQFHIVETADRVGGQVRGEISSWAYFKPDGWRPSELEHGQIEPVQPFGIYGAEADKLLREAISALIASGWTSGLRDWDDLLAVRPDVRWIPLIVGKRSLERLATEFGFVGDGFPPQKLRKKP